MYTAYLLACLRTAIETSASKIIIEFIENHVLGLKTNSEASKQ